MIEQEIRNLYMHGRCLDMASAIGRATGLPVMKLRLRNGVLAHAFVVVDRHLPKGSWRCIDAGGEMPLNAVRSNVEAAFGPVVLSRDETPATIRGVADSDVIADALCVPHLRELIESFAPLSIFSPPIGYEPRLQGARAIAEYVVGLSPDGVDRDMVEDAHIGCSATLSWLPMDVIVPGPPDVNLPNAARERVYARMHAGSTPPILVDGCEIEDGHHRHRVAIARGDPGMWCYRIQEDAR